MTVKRPTRARGLELVLLRYESRLPPVEVTLARLQAQGLTLREIAARFDPPVSQPAVSYRLRRLHARLAVLRRVPMLDVTRFAYDLSPLVGERGAQMLTDFYLCRSVTRIARKYDVCQPRVYRLILEYVRRLSETKQLEMVRTYRKAFEIVWQHKHLLAVTPPTRVWRSIEVGKYPRTTE